MKLRLVLVAAATAIAVFGGVAVRSAASVKIGNAGVIPQLTVGTTLIPPSLDPGTSTGGNQALNYGTETLLTYNPDGSYKPDLAVSWKQLNPFHYRFNLRKGVKFWDGNEMTSDDVANALNYQRFPKNVSSRYLFSIRDVKPHGRYAVDVILRVKDASLLNSLAWSGSIFEKQFWEAHPTTFGKPGTLTMGTGPWIPVAYTPGVSEELDANPHYWGAKPNVQHISIKLFSDETSEALAFRAGQIDIAFPGGAQAWEATAGAKLQSDPSFFFNWFSMNVQKAPWNDIHVRRAIAYALNRNDIVKALGGFVTPVTTLILPNQLAKLGSAAEVNALIKSLPKYPYDLAKARAEMAKSAYPNGFTTTTYTWTAFSLPVVHQVIADELKQIGITWNFKTVTVGQWVAYINGPRDQIDSMDAYTNGPSPDPGFNPGFLLGSWNAVTGKANRANYTPSDVDSLIKQGIGTYDPTKRLAVYKKLLTRVATDLPYIPLYQSKTFLALSTKYRWKDPSTIHSYVFTFWPFEIAAS